jgi:N-acetylneuraminate lyase
MVNDQEKNLIINGLIAAVHTPMHEDKSLNLDMIEKQYLNLKTNKVSGAFLCGTTGEGISLTLEERFQIANKWRAVADRELKLIIHVGHNCIEDCKSLAIHSEKEIAADAIALIGPSYFKPENMDDLISYCLEIASSAPNTPFYYYHMPSINGIGFPMIEFIKLASKKIPTFKGLKYTHEDMMDYCKCLEFNEHNYNIFFGRDEYLLHALTMGAKCAVGSTYNFAAPLYNSMIDAYNSGDFDTAQENQIRAIKLVSLCKKYRILASLKATMKVIGIDCGPCRLPLRSLNDNEYKNFYAELEQLGFFSYCSRLES